MYKRQNVNGSVLISEVGATSTPITIKTNIKEKEMSMNDLFNLLSKRFHSNDAKFDEMNTQNVKFKISMNKRLNEMDECVNTIKEQLVESIEEQIKSNSNNDNKKVTSDGNSVENDNIIKNVVSESETLKTDSE